MATYKLFITLIMCALMNKLYYGKHIYQVFISVSFNVLKTLMNRNNHLYTVWMPWKCGIA